VRQTVWKKVYSFAVYVLDGVILPNYAIMGTAIEVPMLHWHWYRPDAGRVIREHGG